MAVLFGIKFRIRTCLGQNSARILEERNEETHDHRPNNNRFGKIVISAALTPGILQGNKRDKSLRKQDEKTTAFGKQPVASRHNINSTRAQ